MVELQMRPVGLRRPTERRWLLVFVAVEAVVLLLIVTDLMPHLLPTGLATQVGHNSESFALAILLSVVIAWLRSGRTEWGGPRVSPLAVALAAVAAGAAAFVLLGLDDEPRLKTLNEPVFAAALLIPYCALWPRQRTLALVSPGVLVLTIAFFDTDLVRLQAECVLALILAPIGLDLMSRWMLAPELRQSRTPAYLWTAALLVAPFVLMVLKPLDLGAFLDAAVLYAARGNEAFWGMFLVHCLGLVAWAPRRRPTVLPLDGRGRGRG